MTRWRYSVSTLVACYNTTASSSFTATPELIDTHPKQSRLLDLLNVTAFPRATSTSIFPIRSFSNRQQSLVSSETLLFIIFAPHGLAESFLVWFVYTWLIYPEVIMMMIIMTMIMMMMMMSGGSQKENLLYESRITVCVVSMCR